MGQCNAHHRRTPKPEVQLDDPYKDVLMEDVGGLEAQKEWLKQTVLKHLKNTNSDYSWGVKPPKGVLFYGPPGTGKTLLARAFGNELSKEIQRPVKFFHRKGADMFAKWFGESQENLRGIFKDAINSKPSIIFFDEIDGLCPNRDNDRLLSQHTSSVVTTFLGLMDTLPVGEVFVFGATNRLDAVDPAVLRPGRFDKHLEFLPPNLMARKTILQINTAKWKADSQPLANDLEKLGQCTFGFSGADIENLCRDAFFAAFDRHVPDADLDATIDDLKVLEADWNVALKKTKPTDVAVFGSTLYIPRLPDKAVNPLVVNIQKDFVNKLVTILPKRSPAVIDLGEGGDASAKISSFVMWDSNSLSVDVMESMILPGILVHPDVSEYPVYILSHENILNNPPSTQLSYITDTLNQALNSFKPCIIYIPRLNDLVADAKRNPFISRQLLQFRGKPVLLLATSSGPASDLPAENNIRNIFGGTNSSWPVRKPNKEERLDFFRGMLETAGYSERDVKTIPDPAVHAGSKETWDQLLQRAVEQTANDNIELILGLHDALVTRVQQYLNVNDQLNIPVAVAQVLREHARNKLQLK